MVYFANHYTIKICYLLSLTMAQGQKYRAPNYKWLIVYFATYSTTQSLLIIYYKPRSMGYPVRIKLISNGLVVLFANKPHEIPINTK